VPASSTPPTSDSQSGSSATPQAARPPGAANRRVDQQAQDRGGCSLNSLAPRLNRLDKFRGYRSRKSLNRLSLTDLRSRDAAQEHARVQQAPRTKATTSRQNSTSSLLARSIDVASRTESVASETSGVVLRSSCVVAITVACASSPAQALRGRFGLGAVGVAQQKGSPRRWARDHPAVTSPQTLSQADRRIVAAWAADCAERVLGFVRGGSSSGQPPVVSVEVV